MQKELSKSPILWGLAVLNAATCAFVLWRESTRPTIAAANPAPLPIERTKAAGSFASVEKSAGLKKCYETYLAGAPEVQEGAVVVHWTVDEQGHILSPKLMRTDLNDPDFMSCILSDVQKAVVKPPSRAHVTLVAHTFKFKRNDRDGF